MAYYAPIDYLADEAFLDRMRRMRAGDLRLDWMNEDTERVRCRPRNPARGMTYADVDIGSYGTAAIPEVIRDRRSMAPRGSAMPDGLPDMGYMVNRKSEVWADDVLGLYEEAKTRQWNAATDIDWAALDRHPVDPDIEKAFCQVCTFLSEVEMIATDLPAKWIPRINHQLVELKSLLCIQTVDEARHTEVFRKRALAGGVGLLRASVNAEHALKGILDSETYTQASVFLHMLGEGFILSTFRNGEAIAPTPVDKRIFRLVMQDEARHVTYGMMHLRYFLRQNPGRAEEIHGMLDEAETLMIGALGSPELAEPLIVLAGKGFGPENVACGAQLTQEFQMRAIQEYFRRLERAGLEGRPQRSQFTKMMALLGS
jgi:hypothetical protein